MTAAAARAARRAGDYKRALALLRAPESAEAWLLRADLERECGLESEARRSIARFEKLALRDRSEPERAARALDACGRYEASFRLYEAAKEPRAAELAAWLGDFSKAKSLALALPPSATTHRVLAAAAAARGKLDEALGHAERAVTLDPGDAEARVWRAELLRRLGRPDEASIELERALALSRGFGESVGAFFNRMLLAAAKPVRLADRERLLALGIRGPSRGLDDIPLGGPVTRRIEKTLEAMKGNRSRTSTRLAGKTLARFESADPRGPDGEYARVQRLCLLGEPEKAVAAFGRIERSGKALPRLWAYRGEVRLWQGLYEEAIADFDEAVRRDESLPWPRIGKAGALTLLGDPAGALASLADAARLAAPERLWIRRAEARLRAGDARGALEDLRQITSGRKLVPSAWLLEALAEPARRTERVEQLARGCPGFVDAARRELGEGDDLALIEKCLAMMRGNRSLTGIGTYVLASGEMRALPADDEAAFAYRR